MKVIRAGRDQTGWAGEFACTGTGNGGGGCGVVLLVEQADVFRTSRHSYGDTYPEYFNTFECPLCHVMTDIAHVPFTPSPRPTAADERREQRMRDRLPDKA